jgi:hypothetical protein
VVFEGELDEAVDVSTLAAKTFSASNAANLAASAAATLAASAFAAATCVAAAVLDSPDVITRLPVPV